MYQYQRLNGSTQENTRMALLNAERTPHVVLFNVLNKIQDGFKTQDFVLKCKSYVECSLIPLSPRAMYRLQKGKRVEMKALQKRGRGLWRMCLSQYISFHLPPLSELKSLKPTRSKGDEDEEIPIKNLKIRPDIPATCHTCETLVASWLLFIVQL